MRDGYSRMQETASGPAGADSGYFYWHRRSPRAIVQSTDEERDVSWFALPALEAPGEIAQRYDLAGRLLEFRRLPGGAPPPSGTRPDSQLFVPAAPRPP